MQTISEAVVDYFVMKDNFIEKEKQMRNRSKLTLVTNNPNLKTYYVPLARIEVSLHPVKAYNFEDAIWKANNGEMRTFMQKFCH